MSANSAASVSLPSKFCVALHNSTFAANNGPTAAGEATIALPRSVLPSLVCLIATRKDGFMVAIKQTKDGKTDLGKAMVASPAAVGPLFAAKVELCKATQNFDGSDTLAALLADICTYAGYASGTITWSAVTVAETGQ